jgi:hypothetical protein
MDNRQYLADEIMNEFNRLDVGTDTDPYSGLMADYQSLMVEGHPDVVVIKIYDDYADGLYDGQRILEHLRGLSPGDVELDSASYNNVWQSLHSFEL